MPQDKFQYAESVVSPARGCFPVSPSDGSELPEIPKALYVGTGGDIVLKLVDDAQDVLFRNVPSGMTLDVRPEFVRASGTSASDIVGLV